MTEPANAQYLFPDSRNATLGRFQQSFDSQIEFTLDYSEWLDHTPLPFGGDPSETVLSAAYTVVHSTVPPLVVQNSVISSDGQTVSFTLTGGVPGTQYQLYVKSSTSRGQIKTDQIIINIVPYVVGVACCTQPTPTSSDVLAQLLAAATNAATSASDAAISAALAEAFAATATATLYSGPGAPGSGLGVTGSYYIDTTNSLLYGPKAVAGWGGAISLVGPAGLTGPEGPEGPPFTPGPDGVEGVQIRMALKAASVLHTVDAAVPADPTDTVAFAWDTGARTKQGDTLSNFIKATLGWTDAQMEDLYTVAGGQEL